MKLRYPAATLALAVLAACVPSVQPPPPRPAPAPSPTPTRAPPPPVASPSFDNWMDAPRTPGDWFYKAIPPYSYAAYGRSDTDFAFVLRCDRANRLVSLGRVSGQQGQQPMQIRTETLTRLLTAAPRRGSMETLLAADLPAADALLDAMAISKGRFAVEVPGETTLYLPSWPEVTRVIEDCR